MPTIVIETRIQAPIDRCFDLARDVDAHVRTTAQTSERAIAGKTTGLLDLGDWVTFEGVHFGIRQRLTSKIIEVDRPRRFVDEMVKGAFASLRHIHEFETDGRTTVMTDTLIWRSPLGVLGRIADALLVTKHMHVLVTKKQQELKALAERSSARDSYDRLADVPTTSTPA